MNSLRSLRRAFAVSSIALAAPVAAQVTPPPLEAYGELPALEDAVISPSGKVAILATSAGKRIIAMLDATLKPTRVMEVGDVKVRGLEWVGDDALMLVHSETVELDSRFQKFLPMPQRDLRFPRARFQKHGNEQSLALDFPGSGEPTFVENPLAGRAWIQQHEAVGRLQQGESSEQGSDLAESRPRLAGGIARPGRRKLQFALHRPRRGPGMFRRIRSDAEPGRSGRRRHRHRSLRDRHHGHPFPLVGGDSETYRAAMEERLRAKIVQLLERSVGPGKVEAAVSVDLDFDEVANLRRIG